MPRRNAANKSGEISHSQRRAEWAPLRRETADDSGLTTTHRLHKQRNFERRAGRHSRHVEKEGGEPPAASPLLRKPPVRPLCQITAPARPDKPPTGPIISRIGANLAILVRNSLFTSRMAILDRPASQTYSSQPGSDQASMLSKAWSNGSSLGAAEPGESSGMAIGSAGNTSAKMPSRSAD